MIRLLIVDDHTLVRQGIGFMVQTQSEMKVVGEASDGAEAARASNWAGQVHTKFAQRHPEQESVPVPAR